MRVLKMLQWSMTNCRPYMRNNFNTLELVYQLIMTPLMSHVLANADYIEVDMTYVLCIGWL